MKVLISWSGPKSREIAVALHRWLPCVIQACEPWISKSDIDAGARWGIELANQLQQTHFGIICLTKANSSAPWILFEAGALSKFVEEGRVCPFLLDIKPKEIVGPLAQFHAVSADKDGTKKLVEAINKSLGVKSLDEKTLVHLGLNKPNFRQ